MQHESKSSNGQHVFPFPIHYCIIYNVYTVQHQRQFRFFIITRYNIIQSKILQSFDGFFFYQFYFKFIR